MYYSAIGLLALLILLVENQDILRNAGGTFDKPAWRVYRRFLFAVLVYYIADVLWGIIESHKMATLLFADTTVYFIAMAAGVLFWAQYTVVYLDEKNEFGQFLVYAGRIVAGAITVLTLLNIFMPVLFTVDENCVYQALPMRYAVLAVQIFLLILISLYAITSIYRQPSGKIGRYRALWMFGLVMALFLFAQLWFPLLPMYAIAYLLGTCLLHTYVINDEKEEYRRGLVEAEEVRELKQNITSMLDNMPGMTFTKDAETGVYLACNQAFADYAQKADPEEVLGLTVTEVFGEEKASEYGKDDRLALALDQPYIYYVDVSDDAGNPRQIQITKRKYIDFAGRQCVLGICQDVTDNVRIQREHAMSKDAYEQARSAGIIYTHIAQALARGYADLYYVNLDSEEYIEYRPDEHSGNLNEERRGWHFFEECQIEAEEFVYAEDREAFVKAMDRKTLVDALERNKTFVMTYRLLTEEGPKYVTMRVSRMEDDDRYIILGVTDVDEQVKHRRAAERMMEEQVAYARLSALTGDFLCIYVVVPETGRYREFSATNDYDETFAQAKDGFDFFGTVREAVKEFTYPEDLSRFLSVFTKENVMEEIESRGIFTVSYRLMMDGQPVYVQLKAAMLEEREGQRLIVGISDIDSQVRQEEEYVKNLAQARINANVDALTGVKNKHAYLEAEARLNQQIEEHRDPEFAVAILDVNDLKKVNDTEGHKAGDQYLRSACRTICEIFKHSPVFRVGGDEFAVIAQGNDYNCIEELVGRVSDHNAEALKTGGIVIACGMAKYEDDPKVASVYERADQDMYEDKRELKKNRAV